MNKRNAQSEVVTRLFGDDWQRWEFSGGASSPLAADAPTPPGAATLLAVPARQVIATPLWIDGADPSLATEAARLELEVRGLPSRAQGMAGVTLRLLPEGERTLAVAAVFPPELAEGTPRADRFDVSPFFLTQPRDAITLWREGEDVVASFTRRSDVVYWETIDRHAGAGEMRVWLMLTVQRLLGEGILPAPPRIVSWVEGLPADRVAPPGVLPADDLPDDAASGRPTLERVRPEWKPLSALQAERDRAQQERIRNVVLAVAAAYVVLAVGLFIYVGALRWKQAGLANEVARLTSEVGAFDPVRRDWQTIAPTAETEQYPLTLLNGVVEAMPPGNLHLTRFSLEGGSLVVEGEADSFAQASDFYNNLASNASLGGIRWDNQNPAVGPSVTTFNARGALPASLP